MHDFVIPTWIWVNAGVLVAAAAYVGFRLSRPAKLHVPAASSAPATYGPAATSRG